MESAMGLVEDTACLIGLPVLHVASLDLVSASDVDAIASAILGRGIPILGLEGFVVSDGEAMPDMNAIADFSSCLGQSEWQAETLKSLSTFLRSVGNPKLMFEIVL
jgi:hypothetical protein